MKQFIILLFGVLFFSCQSDFKKLGEDDEYIMEYIQHMNILRGKIVIFLRLNEN